MPNKQIMRVELVKDAKRMLEELSETTGHTQVLLMSRLVEWFATQPETIQAIILGRIPADIEYDVAKLLLVAAPSALD